MIETIGGKFFLRFRLLRRCDNFLSILQKTLNELKLVKAQKLEEIVLKRVVGFGGEQHLLQRSRHLGRRQTRGIRLVAKQRRDLASNPQEVEGVAAAGAAAVLERGKRST